MRTTTATLHYTTPHDDEGYGGDGDSGSDSDSDFNVDDINYYNYNYDNEDNCNRKSLALGFRFSVLDLRLSAFLHFHSINKCQGLNSHLNAAKCMKGTETLQRTTQILSFCGKIGWETRHAWRKMCNEFIEKLNVNKTEKETDIFLEWESACREHGNCTQNTAKIKNLPTFERVAIWNGKISLTSFKFLIIL